MARIRGSLGQTIFVALGVVLSAAGCGGGRSADIGDVIRIGVFIREGGDSADEFLAAREINEAGGIRIGDTDHSIELLRVYDGASARGGVDAVRRFADEGAVVAIGPRWSSIMLGDGPDYDNGAANEAIERDLVVISGSATSAAITGLEDDDLIWRTIPSDDIQGAAGARYAYEQRGARSAAIIFRDDAWGRGLSATFVEAFEELGGTVVASASYDPEEDLDGYAFPELDAIFADLPDMIYVLAFNETPQITHRVVQGGYLEPYGDAPPLFLATDGTYDPSIATNGAPEVLPLLFGTVPGPSPDVPIFDEYRDAFEAAGLGPGINAWPYAYDAVFVAALAIQNAQSTDARDIKAELRGVSNDDGGDVAIGPGEWADAKAALLAGDDIDYDGASGPIDFTADGDPGAGYYSLWQIEEDDEGSFVLGFDETNGVSFGLDD